MISVEISRKILHIFSSIIPLSYLWIFKEKYFMILILSILILFSILIEYYRKKNGLIKNIFNYYFNFMLRGDELKGNITGATWLLFGNIITIYLFPIYIAVPALLFLSIGDSFAAIIGEKSPILKIGKKSLAGSLSGFLSSFIIVNAINQVLPVHVIIFGSIIAMLIELIPSSINDNLTIPILSGLFMRIIL